MVVKKKLKKKLKSLITNKNKVNININIGKKGGSSKKAGGGGRPASSLSVVHASYPGDHSAAINDLYKIREEQVKIHNLLGDYQIRNERYTRALLQQAVAKPIVREPPPVLTAPVPQIPKEVAVIERLRNLDTSSSERPSYEGDEYSGEVGQQEIPVQPSQSSQNVLQKLHSSELVSQEDVQKSIKNQVPAAKEQKTGESLLKIAKRQMLEGILYYDPNMEREVLNYQKQLKESQTKQPRNIFQK